VDRWAVAAYIRALQLSQAATVEDVPSGVAVRSLKEIAQEKQLPESYAEPWALPATAVQALPNDVKQGNPAMAPTGSADTKITIPLGKQAAH
jgi:hypothetical protein